MLRENYKNIIYQTAAQIIPRAILFIFTLYLAKILGKEEYGKYDFALSFGYLVGVFFELGGNVILTKYIARGHFSSFKFSLRFRFAAILLTFIVTFAVLFIGGLYSDILPNITYGLLGIAFSSLMNLYFSFFRGLRRMNYEAIVLILQKIIFIALCLGVFIYRKDASFALSSFAASMLVSWQIIQFIYIRQKHLYKEDEQTEQIQFKHFLKDSMTLALVPVFSEIYFRSTQIILEHFAGYSEVGKYGVSYKLIEALTNIPSIIMIVLFPSFAKLAKENLNDFKKNFYKLLIMLSIAGIVAAAGCWVLAKPFFTLIGKDYDQSYIIVRYMSIALLMIFPNYLLTQALVAMDKNLIYATIVFSALVINIITAILIVPAYGAIGSAVSVGICEIIIFGGTFYTVQTLLKKHG